MYFLKLIRKFIDHDLFSESRMRYHVCMLNKLKFCFWIVFWTFLISQNALWGQNALFKKANEWFESGLYEKAIPLYANLLKDDGHENVRLRLAKSYLLVNDPIKVLELYPERSKAKKDALYLLGMAYANLGLDEYASYAFVSSLEKDLDTSAQYALGTTLLKLHQHAYARQILEPLLESDPFFLLAQLQLAKLDFATGLYEKAISRLRGLPKAEGLLFYEIHYWLAKSLLQIGEYEQAIESFQKALPKQDSEKMEWYEDTVYNKILCHLALVEQENHSKKHIEQAKEHLKNISTLKDDLPWLILLARSELLALTCFQEKSSMSNIELHFSSLANAFEKMERDDPYLSATAKLLIDIAKQIHSPEDTQKLSNLLETKISQIALMPSTAELYFSYAVFLCQLAEEFPKAEKLINEIVNEKSLPQHVVDQSWLLLGSLQYNQKNYEKALFAYNKLTELSKEEPLLGDAWYWIALCYDDLEQKDKGKICRKTSFELYPKANKAPEACFSFYTFAEYLQGDRNSLKHLKGFMEKFPDSPYVIPALYLIGLDKKQDRRTVDGKWINKRNITASIEAFQAAEDKFEELLKENKIPTDKLDYFQLVKTRSELEKALAHLAIAEESEGARRQVYLEYAEAALKNLYQQFQTHPMNEQKELWARLEEEISYDYAQMLNKANKDSSADAILSQMLEKYRLGKITRGYLLALTWFEKALAAEKQKKYKEALQYLENAEEASKGKILTTDQRLNIAIHQSHCYRALEDWDHALLTLSKVVNDDGISSLRIKAMVLRAEIYELQGKRELARRQLDSASKKGGEWSQIAAKRLIKDYGYPDNRQLVPIQR